MKDIEELRREIDSIDNKLVELFENRMEAVLKIAEYKKHNNMKILNQNREEEIIKRCKTKLHSERLTGPLEKFLNSLMEISRDVQTDILPQSKPKEEVRRKYTEEMTVGFQGVTGAYSEEALRKHFGHSVNAKPVNEFEDIFIELEKDSINFGVLPIENSSTGGISEVYDLLNKYNLMICGEICLKVNHHLMGIQGATINEITEVYSHPQAFSQCNEFLKLQNSWSCIPFYNTAKSAEYVGKAGVKHRAAIGSARAAEIYNLDILAANINFNNNNTTRFIVISKKLEVVESFNKISVIFSTTHRAGSLYDILRYFAENNLNLLKIESRPIADKPWEYFFYIDFEGNLMDKVVQGAMEEIKNNSSYFKILGNYKGDNFK